MDKNLKFFQKTLDLNFGIWYNTEMDADRENQNYEKPCRVDGVTPCVQYPDDDCGCDPCEDCVVAIAYRRKNEN